MRSNESDEPLLLDTASDRPSEHGQGGAIDDAQGSNAEFVDAVSDALGDGPAATGATDGTDPGVGTLCADAVTSAPTSLTVPDASGDPSPSSSVKSSGTTSRQAMPPNTPAIAKFIFSLPKKLKLIVSQNGVTYVEMGNEGNHFVLRVGSRQLDNLIRTWALYEGLRLRKADISEANDHLISYADMAGVTANVWYRAAPIPGGIELDLGDQMVTRVKVTAGRVEIVSTGSETLFHSSPVSRPMVIPTQDGNLKLLKSHVNLNDLDFLLFIAWLSYTLAHPKVATSKYVILVIQGDQGSGKTYLCNHVILNLLDPNHVGVQVFPGNSKDLTIAAQNAHVLCYDNMRNFRPDMADILCMAATGGAISNRALYTDSDQHIHYLHVALVLNGIHSFITQADLAQRCMPIRTQTMAEANRKSEAAMVKALEADLPVIFRGLLDLIASVFQHLPDAEITNPERMLDFVHWLAAMEKAHGLPAGVYQAAYSSALHQSQMDSLLDNSLGAALIEFTADMKGNTWDGTPAELLRELTSLVTTGTTYSREWPQNPISLSKRLNALKSSLQTQGIAVELSRGKHRTITIRKQGEVHGQSADGNTNAQPHASNRARPENAF